MFDNSGVGGEWFNASSPAMETMGITIDTTSGPFVFFAVNCLNLHIKFAYLRPSTIAFMAFKVKRYYKSRITYYNNAVASFNFLELHTQLGGDIHPQPGPDSQLAIPVRITQALIDRKTAIYHATIQHLLALFRKQCPLVAQA